MWVSYNNQFSSVAQSYPALCDPINCSTPGLHVHHQLLQSTQTHVHRVGDAIKHLILCCPLLLLPSIFPSIRVFSNDSALRIRWQSIGVSASASVLPVNIQDWFPLGCTGLISCCPRQPQESPPTPQFKSISSPVLSFLYSLTLISIHDFRKNNSFDQMDHCW